MSGKCGKVLASCLSFVVILQTCVHGTDYLLATMNYGQDHYIIGATAETLGLMQIRSQPPEIIPPYSSNSYTITEPVTKSFIVSASKRVSVYYVSAYFVFSPLPVSVLGTKYIISYCHIQSHYTTTLVIATHNRKTDVNINLVMDEQIISGGRTYRNGDTLTISLEEYQVFILPSLSDMTGTVISSTQTIAVFIGIGETPLRLVSYDQLPPVKHYGQEYVIAVNDDSYQMQIISENTDTEITFHNGLTASVDKNGLYRQPLEKSQSLYFNTTKPVLTALCKTFGRAVTFVFVPPVCSYTRQALPVSDTSHIQKRLLKILTKEEAQNVKVWTASSTYSVEWERIPGTGYKVGTVNTGQNISLFFISSSTEYTVLEIYSGGSGIFSRGYTFNTDQCLSAPSAALTSSVMPSSSAGPAIFTSTDNSSTMLIVGVSCASVILLVFLTVTVYYIRKRSLSMAKAMTLLQQQTRTSGSFDRNVSIPTVGSGEAPAPAPDRYVSDSTYSELSHYISVVHDITSTNHVRQSTLV